MHVHTPVVSSFPLSVSCRKNKKSVHRSTAKVTKEDISPPLNFKHFYHGEFHKEDGIFSGLPQQWNSLVALARENQFEDTDSSRSVIIEGTCGGEVTYIHAYIHTYIRTYVCTYVCTYIHTAICGVGHCLKCVCVCMHECMCVCGTFLLRLEVA